ncbi:MAG: ribose-5-phosphate isomerase RpiA [Limnobacter sp.]|nr:ribose-5-phosphate isomerase RpiA [Limnobacter sp.]
MDAHSLKMLVGKAALEYVKPGTVLGVGTGSTVDCFIDALGEAGIPLKGAVSSSIRSAEKLQAIGVSVLDLNEAGRLALYIDGADEINSQFHLIKGGGGALTREKIVAEAADEFICIADESKLVNVLGKFPLPVEVIPMARQLISNKLIGLGGKPVLREGFITDNGNEILDVHGLEITKAIELERTINHWPGVVTNGLFAIRPANFCLIGAENGVKRLG